MDSQIELEDCQSLLVTVLRHIVRIRDRVNTGMTLQLYEASDVTMGGVLLPDSAKEKPIAGEVISVGPGKREEDGSRKPPQVEHFSVQRLHLPPTYFKLMIMILFELSNVYWHPPLEQS